MNKGREALIERTLLQAQKLLHDNPLCSVVVVQTGYRLVVQCQYTVWPDSVLVPTIVDDARDEIQQQYATGNVGRVLLRAERSETCLSCAVPFAQDYELPGANYRVRRGLKPMFEKKIVMDNIGAQVTEFCKELLLFVQMYCVLDDYAKLC